MRALNRMPFKHLYLPIAITNSYLSDSERAPERDMGYMVETSFAKGDSDSFTFDYCRKHSDAPTKLYFVEKMVP